MFRYSSSGFLLVVGTLCFHLVMASSLPGIINLAKRQTGTIPVVPPQCASTCNPVNTVLEGNMCTTSTCCVASFEQGYFDCFKCAFQLANITDYTQPQMTVDLLIDDCALAGVSLPRLTFPGQNATRPLSSVISAAPSTQSQSSSPLSGFTQSTVTAVTNTPTSTFVQSTVSTIPTSTSPVSTPSATSKSTGFKAADSTLGFTLSTIMLTACFYLAL